MDDQQHVSDLAQQLVELDRLLPPGGLDICHCGHEKQIGEDHSMCWPGM